MISRSVISAILASSLITVTHANLLPVTGDTSTVWTAIDLLPADQENIELTTVAQLDQSTEAPAEESADPAIDTSGQTEQTATPVTETSASTEEPSTPNETTSSPVKQISTPSDKNASAPSIKQAPPPSTATSTATQTPEQEVAVTDSSDSTAEPVVVPGTIIITSVPDSVNIVINDVHVGMTPYHATGFYPGIYEVTLHKDGFEPYRQTINLQENGTEFITGKLTPEVGYLYVTSVPESATVILNDTAAGLTPYSSKPLVPGIYNLRVEAVKHAPYTEQLGITSKITDTIQVALVPLKKEFFPELKQKLKKSQWPRRIGFGVAAITGGVIGIAFDNKAKKCLELEDRAWKNYASLTKASTSQFTERYNTYLDATKDTDRAMRNRNISYVLGIILGVGFGVSIPF